VIGKQRGAFKRTFEAAQKQLRSKFGMEMVELPAREMVTMKEKRGQLTLCYQYAMLTSNSGEQDEDKLESGNILCPHFNPTT
jgi:hypothetical protein